MEKYRRLILSPSRMLFLLLLTAGLLSSCSSSMSYCRKMQKDSPLPISLEACQECYKRYGELDNEILIGCVIGQDVIDIIAK